MDRQNLLKGFLCGLGAYVVCLVPPMLPIFQPVLGPQTAGQLALAAAMASALVMLQLITEFDRRIGDPGAKFTQALLGIGVCAGLYASLAPVSEPQVVLMSLIWMAVALDRCSPGKVLVLSAAYLTIYLNAFTRVLLDPVSALHGDALYVLLVSLTLCAFMYLRAHDYATSRREKARLRDENGRQAEELEEATARIHAMTRQDMDTIALKYPFFKEELKRAKQRADASGVGFCIGLMEVDHFAALQAQQDEVVVKQVLREVVERASRVLGKLGLLDADDGSHHPVGKVGEGLYGLIMPRSNLKGALACTRLLRSTIELQSIRTMAGKQDVTLTFGVVEYHSSETVEELMESVGRALENARVHHIEELQVAAKAKLELAPVKSAQQPSEMRLLHYKEYDAPVH